MTRPRSGAGRTLRVLVAAIVVAAPICAWLCTVPYTSAREGGVAQASGGSPGATPCHGGHDEPSPARRSSPDADREACCGGCGAPALVSAASAPLDLGPGAGELPAHPVGLALARLALPPVGLGSRHVPPASSTLALRAVRAVVLRL